MIQLTIQTETGVDNISGVTDWWFEDGFFHYVLNGKQRKVKVEKVKSIKQGLYRDVFDEMQRQFEELKPFLKKGKHDT